MNTNTLLSVSRFLLFGARRRDNPSLGDVIRGKAVNLGRSMMGLPPVDGPTFWEWLKAKLLRFWRWLTGRDGNGLPADMPQRLFNTVDHVLRNRGGFANKEAQIPNFWTLPRNCRSTPFFWSIVVDYNPHQDPDKLRSFESSLEDALSRSGYDLNVRILNRPLRIEIDKPKPPMVALDKLWANVAAQPVNERVALLGQCAQSGKVEDLFVRMTSEDFSAFIAGSPGSGKTQLSMSMLLSLAYTNAPERLGIIIVDPKAIDWEPFKTLPHLDREIITESATAAEVIADLVAEMERRTKMAATGDRSFLERSILLYVDELSDLLNGLSGQQAANVATGLQRLAQKGRGLGFLVIGATQRVYDVPASAHTKLNMRLVGKTRNANDSVAASGIPETQTNKLPGKGAFEIWTSGNVGVRIQAPFVADSSEKGYEKKIQRFIDDIVSRWGQRQVKLLTVSTETQDESSASQTASSEIDANLFARLKEAYEVKPEAFRVGTIRRLTGMRQERAERIYAQFMDAMSTNVAV